MRILLTGTFQTSAGKSNLLHTEWVDKMQLEGFFAFFATFSLEKTLWTTLASGREKKKTYIWLWFCHSCNITGRRGQIPWNSSQIMWCCYTGMYNRSQGPTEPTECPTHRLFAFFFFLTDTTYERNAEPGTGRRWMGRNTGNEVMSKC